MTGILAQPIRSQGGTVASSFMSYTLCAGGTWFFSDAEVEAGNVAEKVLHAYTHTCTHGHSRMTAGPAVDMQCYMKGIHALDDELFVYLK